MGIECQTENCTARIGGRQQRFWEGDPYVCAKCGAHYVIGVTSDYSDDVVAFLIEMSPGVPPKRRRGRK